MNEVCPTCAERERFLSHLGGPASAATYDPRGPVMRQTIFLRTTDNVAPSDYGYPFCPCAHCGREFIRPEPQKNQADGQ